jgi:hypothetical protein
MYILPYYPSVTAQFFFQAPPYLNTVSDTRLSYYNTEPLFDYKTTSGRQGFLMTVVNMQFFMNNGVFDYELVSQRKTDPKYVFTATVSVKTKHLWDKDFTLYNESMGNTPITITSAHSINANVYPKCQPYFFSLYNNNNPIARGWVINVKTNNENNPLIGDVEDMNYTTTSGQKTTMTIFVRQDPVTEYSLQFSSTDPKDDFSTLDSLVWDHTENADRLIDFGKGRKYMVRTSGFYPVSGPITMSIERMCSPEVIFDFILAIRLRLYSQYTNTHQVVVILGN